MLFPFHDNNPIRRWPWMTVLIIAVNVVSFVWVSQLPEDKRMRIYAEYGFVPKRISQIRDPNIKVEVDVTPPEMRDLEDPKKKEAAKRVIELEPSAGRTVLSLVTCMFLHGGWMHLIGNVWFLWVFGNNIEDRLGHFIYLFFYLAVGWLATASQWAINPGGEIPIVGASGAIAGVLGAYAVTFPRARVKTLVFLVFFITVLDLPALLVLFAWFGFQIWQGTMALGENVGGVAWWAHIGGFLAGVLMMPIMAAGAPEPGTHWEDEAEREFDRS